MPSTRAQQPRIPGKLRGLESLSHCHMESWGPLMGNHRRWFGNRQRWAGPEKIFHFPAEYCFPTFILLWRSLFSQACQPAQFHGSHKLWQLVAVPVETRTLWWQGPNKDLQSTLSSWALASCSLSQPRFSLILDLSRLMATARSRVLS